MNSGRSQIASEYLIFLAAAVLIVFAALGGKSSKLREGMAKYLDDTAKKVSGVIDKEVSPEPSERYLCYCRNKDSAKLQMRSFCVDSVDSCIMDNCLKQFGGAYSQPVNCVRALPDECQ